MYTKHPAAGFLGWFLLFPMVNTNSNPVNNPQRTVLLRMRLSSLQKEGFLSQGQRRVRSLRLFV